MKKVSFLIALLCASMMSFAAGGAGVAEEYDVNFALSANGSSATSSTGNAALAIDGDKDSRWESEQSDPQEWLLDLGQERVFNTIQIRWEGAYGKTFTIDISSDGENWSNIVSVADQSLAGFPYEQTFNEFDKVTARYVRFTGTARGTGYGYSFYEFRVLLPGESILTTVNLSAASGIAKVGEGTALTLQTLDQNGQAMQADVNYEITPADAGNVVNGVYVPAKVGSATIVAKSGEVSSQAVSVFGYMGDNLALSTNISTDNKVIAQSDFTPNGTDAFNAVDGNEGSVWQGSATNGTAGDEEARTFDSWFVVDLGGFYNIDLVTIKFEGACSELYHLDFSADNSVWNEGYNYVGNAGVNGHTDFLSTQLSNNIKVRYVRFWSTRAATVWGMKIYEMKVFGQEWVDSGDTEKPVMGAASLESKSWNNVVLNVAATDNGTVVAYHVVDATNGINKNFNVTDGKIIVTELAAATAYNFTITAVDAAGNESDNNAQVAVTTDAHLVAPNVAAPVPTWPAAQVISFFSDTYTSPSTWNYNAGWGQTTALEQKEIEGNNYLSYTVFNWIGWVINAGTPYNALIMEKLHIDIWSENDGQLRIVPIYGGDGLATNDNIGKLVALVGQQWNSIDLDLATDFAGLDVSSIFQFKFDGGNISAFCVDNAYFYRTTPIVDNEKPTNLTGSMANASYFSVVLAVSAEDNMGAVNFKVLKDGNVVAIVGGVSGSTVNIDVPGLAAGTNYTIDVVCYDGNDNYAADTVHVAVATLAGPAPAAAPQTQAMFVKSIYSDVYTAAPASIATLNAGWWNPPTMSQGELTAGEHALYYHPAATGMFGWEFAEIDASATPYLHISLYPLADGSIKIYPVVNGGSGDYNKVETVVANQWNDLVLDFTGMDMSRVYQIGWIDYYALNGFFVDNVYFSAREDAAAAPEADRRISAYGLNVAEADGSYTFTFNANIAPTAANLVFYDNDVEVGKIAIDAPQAGLNTIVLTADQLPLGTDMTWAVELTADPVYKFGKIHEDATTLNRFMVAVDNCTESDYFGRIYGENRAGGGVGYVYVYNPDYTIANSRILAGQPKWQSAGHPWVDRETGKVILSDYGDDHGGVYFMDPATLESSSFFVGTQAASTGIWTNASGVEMGSSCVAAVTYGEGADKKLYAINEDAGTTLAANGLLIYNIGQSTTWSEAPSKVVKMANNANGNFALAPTAYGVFAGQNRSADQNNSTAYSLMFYNNEGQQTWVSSASNAPELNGSNGSGVAVSADESQLAIIDGSSNIQLYDIAWGEAGVPTLTLVAKYPCGYSFVRSINFDYAGNLVTAVGTALNTGGKLAVYAMPTMNNTIVVPAKKALTVTGSGVSVGVENTDARYEGVRKVIENGQVYIIRDGMRFTVTGVRVK